MSAKLRYPADSSAEDCRRINVNCEECKTPIEPELDSGDAPQTDLNHVNQKGSYVQVPNGPRLYGPRNYLLRSHTVGRTN